MKYKLNEILEVSWSDIVSDSSWLAEDKAKNHLPVKCIDIGYFTSQDRTVLRISSSYQPEGKDRNVTVIPFGVIKKIRKIK